MQYCPVPVYSNNGYIVLQILSRWNSTVYFTYVKSADKDKRDWTSLNAENASDSVESNMDIFGSARS